MESAETSKRGANLSTSDVRIASGEAEDAGDDAAAVLEEDACRLWKVPCLQR